jgi:hypothetical protein
MAECCLGGLIGSGKMYALSLYLRLCSIYGVFSVEFCCASCCCTMVPLGALGDASRDASAVRRSGVPDEARIAETVSLSS